MRRAVLLFSRSPTDTYTLELREVDGSGTPPEGRAVIIGGAQTVLPGRLSPTPSVGVNPPGTAHTVEAHAEADSGTDQAGVTITFQIVSGPNAGTAGTAITDAHKGSRGCYPRNIAG